MNKFFSLLACTIAILFAAQQVDAKETEENMWSDPVNGLQGRLIFEKEADKTRAFIELRNVSKVINPLEVLYNQAEPGSVDVKVVDADGKNIPISFARGGNIMTLEPYYLVIPSNGSVRFEVWTLYYTSDANDKALIFNFDIWKLEEAAPRYVIVSFSAAEKKIPGRNIWSGTLQFPPKRVGF